MHLSFIIIQFLHIPIPDNLATSLISYTEEDKHHKQTQSNNTQKTHIGQKQIQVSMPIPGLWTGRAGDNAMPIGGTIGSGGSGGAAGGDTGADSTLWSSLGGVTAGVCPFALSSANASQNALCVIKLSLLHTKPYQIQHQYTLPIKATTKGA